ncbi:MAG TPA: DinB family protein [Chitinophagaceae bacterium]|nr:DinB family protein [Chitinophagaceae bacterium]
MKKIPLLLPALLLFSFTISKNSLTEKERKTAIEFLQSTEDGVFNSVKGLSEAQLNFKAAPDRWSIEECVKHIAITEESLWKMTEENIKQAANPEKRVDIKATDEQLIKGAEDRSKKVKTSPQLEPQSSPYKSLAEALESFKTNREKLIAYVKTTDDDLRNHVAALPFGSFDCYQMLLFMGAHSNRHTQQMEEVKADGNYPKK